MHHHHHVLPRAIVGLTALAATIGFTACGDDSSASASEAFCQAEIDVETAVATEDPDALEPAFETLAAEASEDIKPAVDTAIAEAREFLAADGEPTPEFDTAYAELMGYVKENCGFTDIAVEAKEYQFDGLEGEYDAGPAVVTMENDGEEAHELAIMRVNDGITETAAEILALPEEEAMTKVTPAAGTFAMPGAAGHTALELTPGRYIVSCFVPKGMTPEVIEEMEATGAEPEGEPHFMLGMVGEFEVA